MKNSLIILILFFAPLFSFGQVNSDKVVPKRNTVYIEAFGQGVYNSLSFDRLYSIDKKVKTSFTFGLTLNPRLEKENLLSIGIPLSYNWLFGKRNHHLELGLGLTLLTETSRNYYFRRSDDIYYWSCIPDERDRFQALRTRSYLYLTPKIGYRFQNPKGGLFFKVCITPPVRLINRYGVVKDGNKTHSEAENYYLINASTPYKYQTEIFPWFGIGLGHTLK